MNNTRLLRHVGSLRTQINVIRERERESRRIDRKNQNFFMISLVYDFL